MIRGKNGFSLIEVLVGVVLFAVGLLAVGGMQGTSVRGNFSSNNMMLATYAAQDRLEVLMSLPMYQDAARTIYSTELTPGQPHVEDPKTFSADSFTSLSFSRSYTVTNDPNGLKINYLVTWNDPPTATHSLNFWTIRSQ